MTWICWNRASLAGTRFKFLQANQPKRPRLNNWRNTWPMFFISFTSVFSYLCSKKITTLHVCEWMNEFIWHCTYVWRHKDVKARREEHVVTHLPGYKNLTHTSKTRQVKRTQMVATATFMIRVFVTFSVW